MIDLKAIFGDDAAPAAAVVLQTAVPQCAPPGDDLGGAEPDLFAGWVQRPDFRGRLRWEAPDVPEAERWWAAADFEDLPQPGVPCLRCGGLGLWETLAGTWRCQHCEAAAFRRSLDLAARAARLRAASFGKVTRQHCAPCDGAGMVDTLDLSAPRAVQGHFWGFGGA
jgi:hypothetical protein